MKPIKSREMMYTILRLLFIKMFETEVDYNLISIERISIRKNKMICTFEGLGNLIF